jgi:hypothetical protein
MTMLRLRSTILLIFFVQAIYTTAQSQASYSFWKDDASLRKEYYVESLQKKQALIAASPKQYAKDYKEIYNLQFDEIEDLWTGTRAVTSTEVNDHLQAVVKKVTTANPELQNTPGVFYCRFSGK